MHKALKPGDGGDKTPIGPLGKKAAGKSAKRALVTTGNHVPESAADPAKQSSRDLRPLTAEEIANEQTAGQLAIVKLAPRRLPAATKRPTVSPTAGWYPTIGAQRLS